MGLAGHVPGEHQRSHFGHVLWPSSPVSFQLPFHPRGPCQDPKAPCFLPLLFRSMWLAYICSQMVAGLSELHPFLLREGQLSGAKQFPPRGAWARVTKCSGLSLCWSRPAAHPSLSSVNKRSLHRHADVVLVYCPQLKDGHLAAKLLLSISNMKITPFGKQKSFNNLKNMLNKRAPRQVI